MIILLILFCNLLITGNSYAENLSGQGIRPFISIGKRLNQRWSINNFISDKIKLSRDGYEGRNHSARDIQFYDQLSFVYRSSDSLDLGFGYVFQRTNPWSADYVNENRLFQQLGYTIRPRMGVVTMRLRFEERFIKDRETGVTPLSTRLRYRVQLVRELNGFTSSLERYYLRISNEFYIDTSEVKKK